MTAQCLYQSNTADLAGMSRQRKACLRAVRKLQWRLTGELTSDTPPTMPLLMRPAVKQIIASAEHTSFNTLLIGDPADLLCEPQELEALLSVLNAHDIHVFGCQRGRWVEQNGCRMEGPMFNIYHVSPAMDPNPDHWVTEVCVPLAE